MGHGWHHRHIGLPGGRLRAVPLQVRQAVPGSPGDPERPVPRAELELLLRLLVLLHEQLPRLRGTQRAEGRCGVHGPHVRLLGLLDGVGRGDHGLGVEADLGPCCRRAPLRQKEGHVRPSRPLAVARGPEGLRQAFRMRRPMRLARQLQLGLLPGRHRVDLVRVGPGGLAVPLPGLRLRDPLSRLVVRALAVGRPHHDRVHAGGHVHGLCRGRRGRLRLRGRLPLRGGLRLRRSVRLHADGRRRSRRRRRRQHVLRWRLPRGH
mmetsp:Transcript_31048/g.82242  ORF Transcript_31048/g.82242 Transcript_31048/m.82242 type:complete len:263 (+) Transcript_31048:252-1040(+)